MAIETQRIHVPDVRKAAGGRNRAVGMPFGTPRFRANDRMFFTERLGLLLETGTPLHRSLEVLGEQAASAELRDVLDGLRDDVASGLAFAEALRKQPQAFPDTYVSLVAAAERGGFLPEVLRRLIEMEESRQSLRSTLVGALSYPAFLVVFSIAVVIFVLVVVFPKFAELFTMIRDELPVTTLVLMNASEVLIRYWIPISIGSGAALVGLWRWLASPAGAAMADRLAYQIPGLRSFTAEYHAIQFLRVMGLSLANGVPALMALAACRSVVASRRFRDFVTRLEHHVTEGRGLAAGFREATFLPPLLAQMVATGEETGSLARVMGRVADFYEREWRKRLTAVTKLIEPALLLVMGVVVGVIVSSLLLPIFKLSRAVH